MQLEPANWTIIPRTAQSSRTANTALSPEEFQSEQQSSGEPVDSRSSASGKWVLTRVSLDRLLSHFSRDSDEAAARYEVLRIKLQRFFEWKSLPNAEELVDDAINRVARRIDEGEHISNLNGYFLAVAKIIAKETTRQLGRAATLDEIPEPAAPEPFQDDTKERRLSCLDECLDGLPPESRMLILQYYSFEENNKINRKRLAENIGIPMNALRIRAYRLRRALETCLQNCLGQLGKPETKVDFSHL